MANLDKKNTIVWNNFRGGWSDDAEIGPDGSFSSSQNVDTRNQPRGAILNSKLKDTGWSGTGNIMGISYIGDAVGAEDAVIAWTDAAKVYKYNIGTSTWSLAADLSGTADTNKKIYNATTFYVASTTTTYIYFWTQTKVHRCKIDFTGLSVDFASYNGVDDGVRAINNNGTQILFGSGYLIYGINYLGLLDVQFSQVEYNEVITGITLFLDQYKIYTRTYLANTSTKGRQWIWRSGKLGTAMTYKIDWLDLPVKAVVSSGPIDYVVAGSNEYFSSLYQVSGTDRQLIKRWKEGSTNGFIGSIKTFKGMVFVGGSANIYSYGQLISSIGPVFTQEVALGGGESLVGMTTTYNKVWAAVAGKVYSYDRSTTQGYVDGYSPSGEIVSQWFNAGAFFNKKKVSELISEFRLNAGDSVALYWRGDETEGWTLIDTATYDNIDPANNLFRRYHSSSLDSFKNNIFNRIQFKAVLTGNVTGAVTTTTPKFYGIMCFFDFIQN